MRKRGAGETPVLWHLRLSNFNEKARWALDYKRVPHRRAEPTPGLHVFVALALTRRATTFPVLQIDRSAIADSARIIAALEERFPDPPLYPADPADRRRALELEEFFDRNLGPDVRRVAFWAILRHTDLMRAAGGLVPPPALSGLVRRRYGISDTAAAQSVIKIRAAMCLIEESLDGGDHLVGGSFSVADLAAAALLAPLFVPPGLPYRDRDAPVPPSLVPIVAELEAHAAARWLFRTYEHYRPPSAELTRSTIKAVPG